MIDPSGAPANQAKVWLRNLHEQYQGYEVGVSHEGDPLYVWEYSFHGTYNRK